jgi:glycosyltransferase involved in cell wall biosynthesis
MSPTPPIALVHDYLLVRRGAERTFEAIAECFPEAPIYTLLHDPEGSEERYAGRQVHTSFLQRLGRTQTNFRELLPAFPLAVRSLPLNGHRLVISSSSAFAHAVRVDRDARHLCYCHSPFRYAWFERGRALGEVSPRLRPALAATLAGVRASDRAAAGRVDRYLSNSRLTRRRVADYWGRESGVVNPPVEVIRFAPRSRGKETPRRSLLVVGELVAHKRVDIALEAARRADVPIVVVGEGPERERLEARYAIPGRVDFLGRVDDRKLTSLYASAMALVMTNAEEFGIVAVEAMAAGRPVLAAAVGGALETVIDGETGRLVPAGDVEALARAIKETDFERFGPARIRAHAARFSRDAFKRRLRGEIERMLDEPRRVPA